MTTTMALGALALGMVFWLLSAVILDRYENEWVFTLLFLSGILLTAAGFFYFLPVESGSRTQQFFNLVLYILFILGVNAGFYRWLHR